MAWAAPIAVASALALTAYGSSSDTSNGSPSATPTSVDWEHVDPSEWGDLSPEFAACKTGKRQSPIDIKVNWTALLPNVSNTYQLDGSLTTPPCTEGVKWVVSPTPLTFSKEQLAQLTAVYSDNDRPVQPLNGRKIDKVSN